MLPPPKLASAAPTLRKLCAKSEEAGPLYGLRRNSHLARRRQELLPEVDEHLWELKGQLKGQAGRP